MLWQPVVSVIAKKKLTTGMIFDYVWNLWLLWKLVSSYTYMPSNISQWNLFLHTGGDKTFKNNAHQIFHSFP